MGFDLYGVSPSGVDIQQPSEDAPQSEWSIYFETRNNIKGGYFRANVWTWRPIWVFMSENCSDILTDEDIEKGHLNVGHLIDSAKSKKLAVQLKKFLDSGCVDDAIKNFNEEQDKAPMETCGICNGTGTREGWEGWQTEHEWLKTHEKLEPDEQEMTVDSVVDALKSVTSMPIGYKWAHKCHGCNACHGSGKTKPFSNSYHFSKEMMEEFQEFLEQCGGFQIW